MGQKELLCARISSEGKISFLSSAFDGEIANFIAKVIAGNLNNIISSAGDDKVCIAVFTF